MQSLKKRIFAAAAALGLTAAAAVPAVSSRHPDRRNGDICPWPEPHLTLHFFQYAAISQGVRTPDGQPFRLRVGFIDSPDTGQTFFVVHKETDAGLSTGNPFLFPIPDNAPALPGVTANVAGFAADSEVILKENTFGYQVGVLRNGQGELCSFIEPAHGVKPENSTCKKPDGPEAP